MNTGNVTKSKEMKTESDLIDWWGGTVVMALFPIIASLLFYWLRSEKVDFVRLLGDGELILSAFSIAVPSLISFYKEECYQKGGKGLFYMLLFAAFFQLMAYAVIKTNPQNTPHVVYITSGICLVSSILLANFSEKTIARGRT